MENNENYIAHYRKKRFFSERKDNNESNISCEEINKEFSNLSLYKKRKVAKNEYILKNLYELCYEEKSNISNKADGNINMEMEKKLVESHYNKINKLLCNIMFENS